MISLLFWQMGVGVGPAEAQQSDERPSVSLIVDYADGAEKRLSKIAWREGTTVLDVMEYAAKHRHGIRFTFRGKGATAFLESIDDLRNEGGRGRNWIYAVNDKKGEQSFALFILRPGDRVLWKFDKYP